MQWCEHLILLHFFHLTFGAQTGNTETHTNSISKWLKIVLNKSELSYVYIIKDRRVIYNYNILYINSLLYLNITFCRWKHDVFKCTEMNCYRWRRHRTFHVGFDERKYFKVVYLPINIESNRLTPVLRLPIPFNKHSNLFHFE